VTAPFGTDTDAQAGKAAPNDQNVRIDYLHGLTSFFCTSGFSFQKSSFQVSVFRFQPGFGVSEP
jgi:hypothetical protein